MRRIAIIAAMPGELKPFLNANAKEGWLHARHGNIHVWRLVWPAGNEWVAAYGGAGVDAATRAFAAAEKDGPLTAAISVGWVGALTPNLETGKAFSVSEVVDARTGERFEVSGFPPLRQEEGARMGHPTLLSDQRELILVTSPRVADEAEKRRLAGAYGAQLVDMEASAIARLAQMRGIPFYAIKGISDGLNDKLPDFNRFIRSDGQFDMAGMVLFSILRPWYWPSLVRMGENSRQASQSIREAVLDFLYERATI